MGIRCARRHLTLRPCGPVRDIAIPWDAAEVIDDELERSSRSQVSSRFATPATCRNTCPPPVGFGCANRCRIAENCRLASSGAAAPRMAASSPFGGCSWHGTKAEHDPRALVRIGATHSPPRGSVGVGEAPTSPASACDLSAAEGYRAVPRLLRRPQRLPRRCVPQAQDGRRCLRRVPASAPVLPTQATVRDPGQPASRARSPDGLGAAAKAANSPGLDPHRGLLAEPDRAALWSHETVHHREHG